jgi:hypothetical protein
MLIGWMIGALLFIGEKRYYKIEKAKPSFCGYLFNTVGQSPIGAFGTIFN